MPDASGAAGALEVVDWTDGPAWDRLVATTPGATFCHLWGWREVLGTALGNEPVYRAAVRAGTLEGVHPLVRVRSRIFGDHLVSVPFLNYGGPLGTPAARTALAEDARHLAEGRGVDLLELRSRTSLDTSLEEVHRKVTVVLELGDDAERLFDEGLKAKVRSQVRRPIKAGMEARIGPEGVDDFYGVFARHMRDLGTPVLARTLFHDLVRVFPDEVVFSVVYAEGRPVAGGCGFVFGGEFEITWASALREFSREAPNMLLYWSLMEEMIRRGVPVFNFGRCTPGGGPTASSSSGAGGTSPCPGTSGRATGVRPRRTPTGGSGWRSGRGSGFPCRWPTRWGPSCPAAFPDGASVRLVPPAYTPLPPAALLRLAAPSAADEAVLEAQLLEEHGDGVAVLVGSGTQALTLALATLVPPGGSVGLPGWGCYDLASAAVGAGVGVRLYDLEPSTLQPEPASLVRVAAETDVLVLVSFFGIPVEAARLPAAGPERPVLVHDAAQAQGTLWGPGGVPWADATVLSFGRGKGWTGVGGGALLAHSPRARAGLHAAPAGGSEDARWGRGVRGVAQWLLGRPALYGLPARIPALGLGETLYHPPRPLTGLPRGAASVLVATRDAARREAAFRRARAQVLRARAEAGGRVELVRVEEGAAARAGALRLPVLDPGSVDRDAARVLGVLGSYPRPLGTLEALKPLLRAADPTPGSDRLARDLLTLPTHSRTSLRDRARLDAWLDASSPSPRS